MEDFAEQMAGALGVAPLTPEEVGAILRLAREVAHGTDDRKLAPLASFLAGAHAASAAAAGTARPDAVRRAIEAVLLLLPPGAGEPEEG